MVRRSASIAAAKPSSSPIRRPRQGTAPPESRPALHLEDGGGLCQRQGQIERRAVAPHQPRLAVHLPVAAAASRGLKGCRGPAGAAAIMRRAARTPRGDPQRPSGAPPVAAAVREMLRRDGAMFGDSHVEPRPFSRNSTLLGEPAGGTRQTWMTEPARAPRLKRARPVRPDHILDVLDAIGIGHPLQRSRRP